MNDQANPPQESAVAIENPPSEMELRYFYFGFHRALKRYRSIIIIGWLVVIVGCLSFPVGWSVGRHGGIIEIILSCATIVAGLGLVSLSISSLEAYLKIALPFPVDGVQHPFIREVVEIMKDVNEGGWQESHRAIRTLEQLQTTYGLPPLS